MVRINIYRNIAVYAASTLLTALLVSTWTTLRAVPVGNSHSYILMVQPAQDGHGQRLTDGLHSARDRRVRAVSAAPVRCAVAVADPKSASVSFATQNPAASFAVL
jgi:hypothetical protein